MAKKLARKKKLPTYTLVDLSGGGYFQNQTKSDIDSIVSEEGDQKEYIVIDGKGVVYEPVINTSVQLVKVKPEN